MPMVSESFQSKPVSVKLTRDYTGAFTDKLTQQVSCLPLVNKAQVGFRSGPLRPEEKSALGGTSWGNVIKQLDGATTDYPIRSFRPNMVNSRDYTATHTTIGKTGGDVDMWTRDNRPFHIKWKGAFHVESFNGMDLPVGPTEEASLSEAAAMVRNSVPAQSEVDLFLFLGELKDFPKILSSVNYVPRQAKEVGGGYLNYAFGIAPTVSDVRALASTIGASIAILERFRNNSRRQLRRRRERSLFDDFTARTGWAQTTGLHALVSLDGVIVKCHDVLPHGTSSGYDASLSSLWSWSCKRSRVLRTFATYEYFIPEPQGFGSRLQHYQKMADQLVGTGLSPGALYDLTPFSWLVDYFVDIGGLIRYQQAIAGNSVVATRIGHSVEDRVEFSAQISEIRKTPDDTLGRYRTENAVVNLLTPTTLTYKKVRRRSGSPYSMNPTATLSRQQWGILGALGLALSPNVIPRR